MFGIVAVGTLLMRSSLVAILGGVTIPVRLAQALRLVAPAVLAGLVSQGLFLDAGAVRTFSSWHIAAAAAGLVAWKTRSIALTLIVGMAAVWIAELLV